MAHLQKLNCRCEVTAVKFISKGTFLLTAQGPFLSVYDSIKGIYLDSYQLLDANKIHGIRTHSITLNDIEYIIIICFGSRELSISTFNTNTSKIDILHSPLSLNDWIFDAKVLSLLPSNHNEESDEDKDSDSEDSDDEDHIKRFELVIGLMHTQVAVYALSFESDLYHSKLSLSYSLIDTIVTDNSSILYSLSFYGCNRNNLMIAAGDCFNHLLLWNVFENATKSKSNQQNSNKHENKSKIKFRGRRKGAIYDISWSANGEYLCYVSDDRSVQLWKFNSSGNSLQMVYRVYGHQARVFKCWMSDNAQYVVSCSEDSTCRVWNFDGECVDRFEFRYGQIWSVDVCCKPHAIHLYHVALGGADSSIRFHYFLSKKTDNDGSGANVKTIALNRHPINEMIVPLQHHVDSKAFYQINLPNKYFPNHTDTKPKVKKRGKKRGGSSNIRIMTIDSESRIVFATATDIYRVANLSATMTQIRWEKIIALKDIFKMDRNRHHNHRNDEITAITLSRDLFSDYGHYATANVDAAHPSDLLLKYNISTAKYAKIPEDASDSLLSPHNLSSASLNTSIKERDSAIARDLHKEYERWLVIGTKLGRIAIVDLNTNQNTLCFRAHDIGIVSLYVCCTSFQPETLENIHMSERQKRYRARGARKYYTDVVANEQATELTDTKKQNIKSELRFSLSASDLHSVMSNPSLNEEYLKMWGNSSLMLFTCDGNGNITYWRFPLSELQKTKPGDMAPLNDDLYGGEEDNSTEDDASSTTSASVKFETIQSVIKSTATFMNPAKKQICAFCYLPPPKNVLIVGDSRGNVLLFSLLNLQQRLIHKPVQVLKGMHGREPVSVIKALRGIKYIHNKDSVFRRNRRRKSSDDDEDEDDDNDDGSSFDLYGMNSNDIKYHIVSGGKDGKIVEYTFYDRKSYDAQGGSALNMRDVTSSRKSQQRSASDYALDLTTDAVMTPHSNSADGDHDILMAIRPIASTSLSCIDDIVLNDANEMICSGFRSTHFVVWNIQMDYVLFQWNCGGMKRPHHFKLLSSNDQATMNGWIFAYTNSNLSNCIAVYHLDLCSISPIVPALGNVSRPYHSSEIHAAHWLLSPHEIYKMCERAREDGIFSEIEDFVASKPELSSDDDGDNNKLQSNKAKANSVPLSEYFKKLMIASCGEDGLIQIVSIANGNSEIRAPRQVLNRSSSAQRSRAPSLSPRRRSLARRRRRSSGASSTHSSFSEAAAAVDEMYDEWILNFEPLHSERGRVIDIERRTIMEQNRGSRFPLKCCDMVRKCSGDAYLFFGGGAKQYLQAYQVTYDGGEPRKVEWKSLCCTGGDILKAKGKKKKKNKFKTKQKEIEENAISNMDLRIKSVVVVPNAKYFGCWLIVTGNSRGTIRAYTLDEEKPTEFQFEGEDSILHRDNNASSPILSLCSTYSSQTNYHFDFSSNTNRNRKASGDTKSNELELQFGAHAAADKKSRVIPNYFDLAPHLIFSGATDGWIRLWFWDIDTHSIQLVKRLAIHQNGVNSISASWLDAKYTANNHGLLTRRVAILTGGDDQSMTLIIGDFNQTANASDTRKRKLKKSKLLLRKSMSSANIELPSQLQKEGGWTFTVIREIPIATAHIASVRCVEITPILTPNVVKYFNNEISENENENESNLRMNEMLFFSSGDDQKLKCWCYRANAKQDNLSLVDQVALDIGLPNCLSIYYIYNSGIAVSIAGQGMQIVTLPFSKYLFKNIYARSARDNQTEESSNYSPQSGFVSPK